MRMQFGLRRMHEAARNKKFIVFGGGEAYNKFYYWHHNFFDIDYLVDNNDKIQGSCIFGATVHPVDKLNEENFDDIIILVCVKTPILPIKQLVDMGIPAEKIFVMVNRCYVNVGDNGRATDYHNMLLRIETTTLCNFQCSFCLSIRNKRPHNAVMDRDIYDKIVTEGYELGFRKLDLRGYGEPLMDKDFESKVRFAKDLGYDEIFVFTNGYFLTPERYKSCMEAGLSYFIVSLSPKREFELTRGIPYETITGRLCELRQACKPRSNSVFVHIVTEGTSVDELHECRNEIEGMRYISRYVDVYKGPYSIQKDKTTFMPCFRAVECVTVFYDGKVSACGFDLENEILAGDLTKQTLESTVNSQPFSRFRAAHLKSPMKSCLTCDIFKFRFQD